MCALCSTHSPPPEGVCIGAEVCVDVFLCQVDKEGGKDQDQETYVPGCNQLLRERRRGRYQSHLSATATASLLAVINVSLSSLLAKFPSSSHLASTLTRLHGSAYVDG